MEIHGLSRDSRHFISVVRRDGMLADLSTTQHPTQLYGWGYTGETLNLIGKGTYFGFVVDGQTDVISYHAGFELAFTLTKGMYFSVPGAVSVRGGCGIAIASLNYRGMFMIGGPIEEKGRLRYMDGCSDSLLIPPTIKGDPCLNHLHFPPGINQTRHTHPSIRIGVVTSGEGHCEVPEHEDGSGGIIKIPLIQGQIFVIPPEGHHSFFTRDSTLDIIAYHPDSDIGPTHDDHPMINRTYVDGISAREIDKIRTKSIV
ncbi:MAG: cupin domain-containing protein [Fischerella sp. CENA71]|nr:cupin domain-containing protein [Fischerella sp. CENA71]